MKTLLGIVAVLFTFAAWAQSGLPGGLHTQSGTKATKTMTLECREAASGDKIKKDSSWGSKKVLICVVK